MCKYPLLLRELLKATPLDHPDHAEVASAAAMIEASVNAINETKRDIENAAKLNELQQKYGLTLLEGGRYHVYEGHLGLLVKRKIKKTYVYLLSDTLLITTSKELIETLSLKNALVNDTAGTLQHSLHLSSRQTNNVDGSNRLKNMPTALKWLK